MKKITIDSSVFLSSVLEGDRFGEQSRRFFESLTAQDVIIIEPITVLLEVVNILVRNGSRNVAGVLERLLQFQILEHTVSSLPDAQFVFQKCRLKTADALIVWCASVSESTLVSWDNKLLREARKIVTAGKPTDYV